jgi:hypothetical protein
LGDCDEFDNVIADFSIAYADQNQMDHAVLKRAIRGGEVEAVFERDEVKRVRGDLKKNEDTEQNTSEGGFCNNFHGPLPSKFWADQCPCIAWL